MALNTDGRIEALDLIRGVAVLGILTVNILAFAGPTLALLTPNYPVPASAPSQWLFSALVLLFEGKMRGLFTLLFGASMALLIDRTEAAGRDGVRFQARRLAWLMLFGLLHFMLLWPGDILFTYAVMGMGMLALQGMETKRLFWGALVFFLLWHAATGLASALTLDGDQGEFLRQLYEEAATETAVLQGGYGAMLVYRTTVDWHGPLDLALVSLGETAPLMAIGIVLYRVGFFSGGVAPKVLRTVASVGMAGGALLTLAFLAWVQPRGFPPETMLTYLLAWSALPHLLMTAGYAAGLVLIAPRLRPTWLGKRLTAAGRMAFSNYVGTSLVMCLIFNGWGLGLALKVDMPGLLGFVVLGWVLMLGWSAPWLTRFRQGPLEWLWRSLVEGKRLPFRKTIAIATHSH